MVIGIQNSPGSTLMTLADMSVITAEVQVDETDIVNVKLGQPAEVTIDAIPKKIFKESSAKSATTPSCAPPASLLRSRRRQPGSKRLQSGRDFAGSAAESAAWSFRHRQDHDGHAQQRAHHSHPGLTVRSQADSRHQGTVKAQCRPPLRASDQFADRRKPKSRASSSFATKK